MFGSQYEGGANWLEATLLSLGLLQEPPTCIVLDATSETLPESLRSAEHVRAVPLQGLPVDFRRRRPWKRIMRRAREHFFSSATLKQVAAKHKIDLWVGFAGFPGLTSHRNLVCFPDFQFRYFPRLFDLKEIQAREKQWSYVARHADGIVTISEATASDALKLHPEIKPKLYVCGFPPVFKPESLSLHADEVRRKYSLPERFFLVCNQFWEHKNHMVVFRALHLLKKKGQTPPVVAFTGRPYDHRRPDAFSEMLRFVQQHDLHECCRFLGVLPRSEQIALIRAAEAVIQPSKFEGRGAITEETCLLGTKLLCSDLPVHRELDLPGAVFFEPDDVEKVAELLQCDYPHSDKDSSSIVDESLRRAREYGKALFRICQSIVQNGT